MPYNIKLGCDAVNRIVDYFLYGLIGVELYNV